MVFLKQLQMMNLSLKRNYVLLQKRKWGDLEDEIEGFYKEEQKKAQSDDMCLIMIQTNAK